MMKDKILFSVIVPIYNVQSYLPKCIDSILCQSFRDFELILVDDGSVDSSPLLCDEYGAKDARIKVVHKGNGGQSSARNAGLEVAKGKYVLFVDSDDYLCDNQLLESLHNRIEKFAENVVLLGCKVITGENEKITNSNYDITTINLHDKNKTLLSLIATRNFPGSAWIMCVEKKVIDDLTLRFRLNVTAEDYEWIVAILQKCETIGAIQGVHYAYVRRMGSLTMSAPKIQSISGCVYAIERYEKSGVFCLPMSQFLSKVYLVMLKMYIHFDRIADRNEVKKQLISHIGILKVKHFYCSYYFIRIFGLKLSSELVNYAYKIFRG